MQNVFVTGAAGFIGSNLVDRLLADGVNVTGWDNLSTGQLRFLQGAQKHSKFKLVRGDNLDLPALTAAMKGADFVFHLAANADIKDGWSHPEKDLQQNTIATFNVLEAMRANGVKRIAFSSTGSVYGEAFVTPDKPTPETDSFPIQTSLYGASKTAGEGLLAAYAEGNQIAEAYIFRFVSILGERYTHGHVFDFYKQLIEHPDHLRVLGDGTQRKSYLYVQDCIAAMLHATPAAQIDTTLLIVPALTDFLDFHSLTERAESLLAKAGYEGELQLASFHPHFVFADADPDDIANATNRAPVPILHLLREDSIARAAAAVPDAADIYERNIATMEKLGAEGWAEMAKRFSKTPPRD